MEKKKNNIWLTALLVIIILGLVGYIVYDKVLSKDVFNNKQKIVDGEIVKEENNDNLVGTYNRGTCAETGDVNCATLIITEQNDNSIYFELSAIKGIMEKGPNVGNLSGVANIEDKDKYKFYVNEYDTETIILFKFDENKVTIEESYSTGNNPYGGHGVYFSGTYKKNKNQNINGDNIDGSRLTVNESKYSSIIDEYSRAMKDEIKDDSEIDERYNTLNVAYISDYHFRNNLDLLFYYSFYDIDKNGVDELLIGYGDDCSSSSNGCVFVDIYSYNNNPVKLEKVSSVYYRTYLRIYDNGILGVYGSGSAVTGGASFYKIASDGYTEEELGSYSYEFKDEDNVVITDENTNEVTNYTSLDDIEFIKNANDINYNNLNWKKIS